MSEVIEHKGIVREIGPEGMRVGILAASACAGCHASGICGMADSTEKEVEIRNYKGSYTVGETVQVNMQEALGLKALIYSYIFPFLLVLAVLVTLSAGGLGELISGLVSLGILLPYYLVLYFRRHQLEKVFHFSVEKLIQTC